ncbi:MAG: polysaccharide deacetylase family protein, partial [Candidatus Krumholzibacteria bacterium]|nr:polysaccharide deacetylase family protein [Candidatus Krumholzibacteria bacterium]
MAYHRSSAPGARDASRGAIPRVLAYHKVTGFELGGTWVPPGRFERQIDALLAAGFRFIDETLFLDALDGRRESSGREVLLTFDDGYRVLLDRAIPALESRGIRALIFLVSAFAGAANAWELNLPGRRFMHLGWDEIDDLARRGFAFGSHARTHRVLTRLSL